ncbi:MAG: ATP synthase F1 subunit gamma, partial [Phenylobacterium sp.]
MASLKEMRDQIKSVQSTQKITRAMQMVAAAKMRRATEAAQNARPYAQRMATVIANLAAGVSGDGAPKLLVGTGRQDRHLVVVTSSDRGLAGGFNSSIIRAARDRINALLAEGKDVKILTVGKKARDQLRRLFADRFVASFEAGVPGLASAQPVADKISELFEAGQVDVVTLAFSRYKSVVVQTPTLTQLIPAQVEGAAATIDLKGAAYEYEPDEEAILETLLPRN